MRSPVKRKRFTRRQRHAILTLHNYRCSRCGRRAHLEVHHETRVKDGGDNSVANLNVLCRYCHIDEHKADKTPGRDEWEALIVGA